MVRSRRHCEGRSDKLATVLCLQHTSGILSSLLWIPDIDGFRQRLNAVEKGEIPPDSAKHITILVLILEDVYVDLDRCTAEHAPHPILPILARHMSVP